MKKLLTPPLLLSVLCVVLLSFGFLAGTPENTFKVNANGRSAEEVKQVIKAVSEADMDMYRLREKRRILSFENGITVELYSAMEMIALGYKINPGQYAAELPANYKEPLYTIKNGMLVQLHQPASTSKSQIK